MSPYREPPIKKAKSMLRWPRLYEVTSAMTGVCISRIGLMLETHTATPGLVTFYAIVGSLLAVFTVGLHEEWTLNNRR